MKLYLYSVFHLNLAFSLIPEDDYPRLIDDCYWPLLELAEEGIPVGIEATASTLREIERRDRGFIKALARLWEEGRCEFVGSGLAQIIMPLVPAEVNLWNLEFAGRYYRELLGDVPTTVLVNEQTYSRSLVDLYRRAGYKTLIMDWNNCYQHNRYPREFMYYPQTALGVKETMDVVWNHSIAFQKFQRFVHGEYTEEEYLEFIRSHASVTDERALILYGNDAEVFDYRPGRGAVQKRDEYFRIRGLLLKLREDERMGFTSPGGIVEHFRGHQYAFNRISLESAAVPIPCKKQLKYNPTRWAVAGRDSVHINTSCHKVYENIKAIDKGGLAGKEIVDRYKEMLCELWGSDFRTNTIDEKYQGFQDMMGWLKIETGRLLGQRAGVGPVEGPSVCSQIHDRPAVRIYENTLHTAPAFSTVRTAAPGTDSAGSVIADTENTLKISTGSVEAEFIKNKGFSIRSLRFPGICSEPLVGTLEHGYYEDMRYGADFFSGHLIHVARDGKKTTDLVPVEPHLEESVDEISVSLRIPLDIGMLEKSYTLSKAHAELAVSYSLKVDGLQASSLRLGIFTFIPEGFDRRRLWFETINGGFVPERFYLDGHVAAQDDPVSQRVSASGCLGSTEGWVAIGDMDKCVRISTDKSELYSVPLLRYTETEAGSGKSFFLRISHSVGEVDDTAWWVWRGYNRISFRVTAHGCEEETGVL